MSKKKYPLVSICIPNYNYGRYLDGCIQSAINQTYPNIEVIFSDNCSTDNSMEIANKYKDRIKIYQNDTNIGAGKNFDRVCRLASGKYVILLAADDVLRPTIAEKAAVIMNKNKNVGFVMVDYDVIDEHGEAANIIKPFYDRSCIVPKEKQLPVWAVASLGGFPQTAIRKELLEKINIYNTGRESNFMDWEGCFKYSMYSDMGYINEKLMGQRIHSGALGANHIKRMTMAIDRYLLYLDMLELAEQNKLENVLQRREEMEKKVSNYILNYAIYWLLKAPLLKGEEFAEDNIVLFKKYLFLIQGFDLEIANNPTFKLLQKHVYQERFDAKICLDEIKQLEESSPPGTQKPFVPPCGYIPLREEDFTL